MTNCSCGCAAFGKDSHVIATRKTHDNFIVEFWSDGAVTGAFGNNIIVGSIKSNRFSHDKIIQMTRLASNEVCLFKLSEVRNLALIAKRAVSKPEPLHYLWKNLQCLKTNLKNQKSPDR